MKTSLLFTTAAVLSSMMVALPASAAPVAVYTMTSSVVSQKLAVSGCSNMITGGLSTITFNRDDLTQKQTFTMTRTGPGANDNLPVLDGTWDVVTGSKSNTIYMNPYNSSVGPDPSAPPLPSNGIDGVLGALNVFAKANCALKYPGAAGNSVEFIQPSILVTKGIVTVKSDDSATLSLTLKGKQENSFKGTPKTGTVSSTTTIKGAVTRAAGCQPAPAACSIATAMM